MSELLTHTTFQNILYLLSFIYTNVCTSFNHLEPEFYILILAHHVCKMRTIQEPNNVVL